MEPVSFTRRDHQQARALASYGRTAYQKLNERLRDDTPLTGPMRHMHDCLMGFMHELDHTQLAYSHQGTLYRGGVIHDSDLDNGYWSTKCFTSTSTNRTIAEIFIGDEKGKRSGFSAVFMTIKPVGALGFSLNQVLGKYEKEAGKRLHYMRHEAETILAPDTMFFVQSIKKRRDFWYDMPILHVQVEATAS